MNTTEPVIFCISPKVPVNGKQERSGCKIKNL
jgi:hypothetical protein